MSGVSRLPGNYVKIKNLCHNGGVIKKMKRRFVKLNETRVRDTVNNKEYYVCCEHLFIEDINTLFEMLINQLKKENIYSLRLEKENKKLYDEINKLKKK